MFVDVVDVTNTHSDALAERRKCVGTYALACARNVATWSDTCVRIGLYTWMLGIVGSVTKLNIKEPLAQYRYEFRGVTWQDLEDGECNVN